MKASFHAILGGRKGGYVHARKRTFGRGLQVVVEVGRVERPNVQAELTDEQVKLRLNGRYGQRLYTVVVYLPRLSAPEGISDLSKRNFDVEESYRYNTSAIHVSYQ